MVMADLITDSYEGVRWWHVLIEGGIALASLSEFSSSFAARLN